MFRKLAILILCGFLFLRADAQKFDGGFTLGISTSQVGGDNLAGFHKAGLLIGIFANKNISELLRIQMEINYIQKGSNNPDINNYDHPNYLKEDISLSYVEIPLLIQYNIKDKLKIEAGNFIAFLNNGYYNDLNGKIPNNTNPFINYDIGLIIGIDYQYSEHISLNTRFSNSILPIGAEDYKNQNTYNTLNKGKYNSVLCFALHYNF